MSSLGDSSEMFGYGGVFLECDLLPVSRNAGVLPDMLALVMRSISPVDRIRSVPRIHKFRRQHSIHRLLLYRIAIHRDLALSCPLKRRACLYLPE